MTVKSMDIKPNEKLHSTTDTACWEIFKKSESKAGFVGLSFDIKCRYLTSSVFVDQISFDDLQKSKGDYLVSRNVIVGYDGVKIIIIKTDEILHYKSTSDLIDNRKAFKIPT